MSWRTRVHSKWQNVLIFRDDGTLKASYRVDSTGRLTQRLPRQRRRILLNRNTNNNNISENHSLDQEIERESGNIISIQANDNTKAFEKQVHPGSRLDFDEIPCFNEDYIPDNVENWLEKEDSIEIADETTSFLPDIEFIFNFSDFEV